jgi:DNA-binding Lrp family transcriptional regulator
MSREEFVMTAHEMKRKTRAFVYIDVKPGKEKEVLNKLLKNDEVIEAHIIVGQELYDVLVLLSIEREVFESPTKRISEFVINTIRKLGDVRETNTLIPAISFSKR